MLTTEKEKKQLLNISKTLLEASEHLLKQTKEKKLQESLYMFTSIIEGYNAIHSMITNSDYKEQLNTYEEKFLKSINLIATELESNNLLKVTEILQFTFIPLIRKWNKEVHELLSDGINEKKIAIGVYNDKQSPLEVYPEARIKAMVNEAENANATLIFFTSDGVNLEDRLITGKVYIDGAWTEETVPYPDVINNILPKNIVRQSRVERKLRREIPFTSFAVGNKIELPRRLVKYKNYADLLVPFKIVKNAKVIIDYVQEHNKAVLKPILGNQGRYIYFIEKKNNKFILSEHKQKKILNETELTNFINDLNINKNIFIIQKYINARTKAGEPFDLRAHMQKDGNGKWQITRLYPRIGPKESILSNISRGGRSEDIKEFFDEEFNSKDLLKKTEDLAMDLTQYLDRIHGFALDELGLDIAIDEKQKFWLHEVNLGPQTTYHEELRAKNVIAYSKYLAKNQIFHSNLYNEKSSMQGAFDSTKSNLDHAKLDYSITIGMLVSPDEINELVEACAYVAKFEEVNFYYFTPDDIDYEEMLIRGYFYINYEWKPMIVEYPDVIYDRLRLKGVKKYDDMYQEFQDIPFTNEFDGGSINKLEVYNLLKSSNELNPHIIPYEKIEKPKQIIHQLDKYEKVIVKPTRGSFAVGVHYIEKLDNFDYLLIHKEDEKKMNEFDLLQYFRNILKNGGEWVVQKFIETRTKEDKPFDIRVHLMKDYSNNWSFVNIYPRIGYHFATISSTGLGGYIGGLEGFLNRHYESSGNLNKKIKDISISIANHFENQYSHNMSELGLDLAIDDNANIYIIEINVNKVGIIYYDFRVAKHAIPYAKRLAMQQQ